MEDTKSLKGAGLGVKGRRKMMSSKHLLSLDVVLPVLSLILKLSQLLRQVFIDIFYFHFYFYLFLFIYFYFIFILFFIFVSSILFRFYVYFLHIFSYDSERLPQFEILFSLFEISGTNRGSGSRKRQLPLSFSQTTDASSSKKAGRNASLASGWE